MAELGAFLLPAVPLLALLICLLFGRYPGCEAIVRFSERIAAAMGSRRAGTSAARPAAPRPSSFAPGGGLLIALSLAQRPPPLPA